MLEFKSREVTLKMSKRRHEGGRRGLDFMWRKLEIESTGDDDYDNDGDDDDDCLHGTFFT